MAWIPPHRLTWRCPTCTIQSSMLYGYYLPWMKLRGGWCWWSSQQKMNALRGENFCLFPCLSWDTLLLQLGKVFPVPIILPTRFSMQSTLCVLFLFIPLWVLAWWWWWWFSQGMQNILVSWWWSCEERSTHSCSKPAEGFVSRFPWRDAVEVKKKIVVLFTGKSPTRISYSFADYLWTLYLCRDHFDLLVFLRLEVHLPFVVSA